MTSIDPDFIDAFDEEFAPQCGRLEELAEQVLDGSADRAIVQESFRIYHTIKGNALSVGLAQLGAFVHQAEEVLRSWRDGGHAPSSTLGEMMTRVSDELQRLRAQPDAPANPDLVAWMERIDPKQTPETPPATAPSTTPDQARNDDEDVPSVTVDIPELDRIFHDAEGLRADLLARGDDHHGDRIAGMGRRILGMRSRPVRSLLPRLKRMVRETAASLGREVDLIIAGDSASADAAVVTDLAGALPHLLRNGLDHGLEAPADREATGKPRRGRLELGFRFEGGSFIVRVAEDGRGMDDRAIARSAVGKGLLDASEAEALTRYERLELVFRAGFSTAATVSTVSGRGVGMDAVAAVVDRHGGRIDIDTTPGAGTAFELVFPVPYRYDDYLLVALSGRTVGLPVSMVSTLMAETGAPVVDGMATIAGEPLVVVGFSSWDSRFGDGPERPLMILDLGGMRAVMAVDQIVGFASALVQGLPSVDAGLAFLSGIGRAGAQHFWAVDDGKLRQDWNAFTVPLSD